MKMIIAVIQPTKLRGLKEALCKAGIERVTICDSQEFAKHTGRIPFYRGLEYRTDILRKITLEIAVNDDFLEKAIDIIIHVAKTGTRGNDGDGKIFVLPLHEAIHFGADTRGPGAI
jgi:nitrogen regulatory protein P-II 1